MNSLDKVGSVFLQRILVRMKELGVTQTELAKRMKASRPYVVNALHGHVNITFGSAARFARALGMDFFPEFGLKSPVKAKSVRVAPAASLRLGGAPAADLTSTSTPDFN